jgi:hypothetical protein
MGFAPRPFIQHPTFNIEHSTFAFLCGRENCADKPNRRGNGNPT